MATVFTADKSTREASQENVRDAFSANLGEQLVNIPEDEADFQQRKGAWKNFLSGIKNNPQAQQFLITAGLTMASGAGMGQGDDDVDNLRNSIKAGLTAVGNYSKLQEEERQRQFSEQQTALNNISGRQLQAAQADQALRSGPSASDIHGAGGGGKGDNLAQIAWELAREEADTIYGETGDATLKQAHINAAYPKKLKSLQTQGSYGVFTQTGSVPVEDEDGDLVPVDTADAQFASLTSALATGYNPETGEITNNSYIKKAIDLYGAALDEETLALAKQAAIAEAKGDLKTAAARRKEFEKLQLQAEANDVYDMLITTPRNRLALASTSGLSIRNPSEQENREYLAQVEALQQGPHWAALSQKHQSNILKNYENVKKELGE